MVITTGECAGSETVNKSIQEGLKYSFCLRVKPSHSLKEFCVAKPGDKGQVEVGGTCTAASLSKRTLPWCGRCSFSTVKDLAITREPV